MRGWCPVILWMRWARASRNLLCLRTRCGPYWQVWAWSRCVLLVWVQVLLVEVRLHGAGWVVCGLSRRILAAVENSSLVSGAISWVGVCNHAPAPVPLVDKCTAIPLASNASVKVLVCWLRMWEVSCFCWCLAVVVSGVISTMVSHSAGSTLSVAVRSCARVWGSWSSRSPNVVYPVWVRILGATCCQLASRAVSLMWVVDVKPKPPLLMEVKS